MLCISVLEEFFHYQERKFVSMMGVIPHDTLNICSTPRYETAISRAKAPSPRAAEANQPAPGV